MAGTVLGLVVGAPAGMWLWTSTSSDTAGDGPDDRAAVEDHTEDAAGRDPDAGRVWQRLPQDAATFGGAGEQAMGAVVATDREVVAVGRDDDAAAVWTSSDGRDWQRVPHDEEVFGGGGTQEIYGVIAGGPGLVAVGRDGGREAAAVWTSSDGRDWERVSHDEATFGGDGDPFMYRLAEGDAGLVAVGEDLEHTHGMVWTSQDGRAWQRIAHDPEVFGSSSAEWSGVYSIVEGGTGLVAVGLHGTQGAAGVWTSPDGDAWARIAHHEERFGGDDWQIMLDVTRGGPGLVAVGRALDDESAVVWTSPDGLVWERIDHEEAVFGGEGQTAMWSVVETSGVLVAVGEHDDDAAVWVGE